jgi:putative aldouronate transport system permease protein
VRQGTDVIAFKTVGYIAVSVAAILCLLPFWLVISASFTSESSIFADGFRLVPGELSAESYRVLFKAPKEILRAYRVSITVTVFGGGFGLFIVAMTGYVLSRRHFRYRNTLSLLFYFTSIFSAGLIPLYILVVNYLGLKNNLLALILPPLLNAWYIILMRSFMTSVPAAISESATIDGANEFQIFTRLYLPISTPGLATIGLFIALFYWNNWHFAMMFIERNELYPLQYFLYEAMSRSKALEMAARESNIPLMELPQQSMRMAIAVVATGPIVLLYPFVQRYFVKGLTVGAVKG